MSDRPRRQWAKVTLIDGRVFDVGVDNRDFRGYDMTYKSQGWPAGTEALFIVQNFVYAHALVRTGQITDLTPAALTDQIAFIDDESEEEIRPTGGAPGPDSSLSSP